MYGFTLCLNSISSILSTIINKTLTNTVLENETNDSLRKRQQKSIGIINLPTYIQMQQEKLQYFESRMEKGYKFIVMFGETHSEEVGGQ